MVQFSCLTVKLDLKTYKIEVFFGLLCPLQAQNLVLKPLIVTLNLKIGSSRQ